MAVKMAWRISEKAKAQISKSEEIGVRLAKSERHRHQAFVQLTGSGTRSSVTAA